MLIDSVKMLEKNSPGVIWMQLEIQLTHLEINMGGFPSADSQASMIAALTNGWVKFILFILKFNVLAIIHLDYCETITQHCQSIMTKFNNNHYT